MAGEVHVTVSPAQFPQDGQVIADLFIAYAKSLEIDLAYQNFEDELAGLPGKYSDEKGGALFVACSRATHLHQNSSTPTPTPDVIGCVALRSFSHPSVCEIKRLYIKPTCRGSGAGRKLLEAVVAKARELGYGEMLLDTLPSMVAARKLYAKYGFEEVERYYESPIEGTKFMRLKLQEDTRATKTTTHCFSR